MAYEIGQFVWDGSIDSKNQFMSPVQGEFEAARIKTVADNGVIALLGLETGFLDECLYFKNGGTFEANTPYFFHGRIMRLPTEQTFNIQLRVLGEQITDDKVPVSQFVKRITVAKKSKDTYDDWVDVHFIFMPVTSGFNCLDFVLSRSAASGDFEAEHIRFPAILYTELSQVNNIIQMPMIKIGIQSKTGLEICVNGEDMTIGRTGVYEVKNGLVTVNSFSVVSPVISAEDLREIQLETTKKYWSLIQKTYVDPDTGELIPELDKDGNIIYIPNPELLLPNNSTTGAYIVEGTDLVNSLKIQKSDISGAASSTSRICESSFYSDGARKIEPFILDYMYKD